MKVHQKSYRVWTFAYSPLRQLLSWYQTVWPPVCCSLFHIYHNADKPSPNITKEMLAWLTNLCTSGPLTCPVCVQLSAALGWILRQRPRFCCVADRTIWKGAAGLSALAPRHGQRCHPADLGPFALSRRHSPGLGSEGNHQNTMQLAWQWILHVLKFSTKKVGYFRITLAKKYDVKQQ